MMIWSKSILVLSLLLSSMAYGQNKTPRIHIIWLLHNDNPFWKISQTIIQEAAQDLDIKFTLLLCAPNDRLSAARLAEETLTKLKKEAKTSYYLATFGNFFGAEKVLKLADEKNVPVFIFNSPLPFAFAPRQGASKIVIGAMLPNDQEAGYLQAKALFAEAKKRKFSKAELHVLALGSWNRDAVGEARHTGLKIAAKEDGVIIDQYFHTRWRAEVARDQMLRARQKFPDTRIVWTAADYLGLVALEAAGKEVSSLLVGGVDWSGDGLASLQRDNGLFVSVGGHFMEPAWISALIYDYHHGLDFKQLYPSLTMQSRMSQLDRSNIQDFLKRYPGSNWGQVDYRSLTRTHSKKANYDFSFDSISVTQ